MSVLNSEGGRRTYIWNQCTDRAIMDTEDNKSEENLNIAVDIYP